METIIPTSQRLLRQLKNRDVKPLNLSVPVPSRKRKSKKNVPKLTSAISKQTTTKTITKKKTRKASNEEERIRLESAKKEFLNKLITLPNFLKLGNTGDSVTGLKNNIKKYFIDNKYVLKYARSIFGDFVSLLREEDYKYNISPTIGEDCLKNFKNSQKTQYPYTCFCCGKAIEKTIDKDGLTIPKPGTVACDHVIPIITMLATVKPESVPYNLHYIHTRCNGHKVNKNIFETYNSIGNFPYTSKTENDSDKCKKMFLNILRNIEFRSINEGDIEYRLKTFHDYHLMMQEIKSWARFYLIDKENAALVLTNLQRKTNKSLLEMRNETAAANTMITLPGAKGKTKKKKKKKKPIKKKNKTKQ